MGLATAPPQPLTCSAEEKRLLTGLAHEAIRRAIHDRPAPKLPTEAITEKLATPAATFVTLTLDGKLRGCVGNLAVREPLYRSIANNAAGAALRDTRFSPVTIQELERLEFHISILSRLHPVQFKTGAELLAQLTPGRDGVALRLAGRTATYLPQVWRTFPEKEAFLGSLCRKAGLDAAAWTDPRAEVLIYRVSEFGDTDDA